MEMEMNLMKGYLSAYKLACEELASRDPEQICMNSNAAFGKESSSFRLTYLNREYKVDSRTGEVSLEGTREEVPNTTKVLLLHYLLNAQNKPLTGRLISFKELKSGAAIYYQTFHKRAITPLVKTFANNLEVFYKAASLLDGEVERYGHASITAKVLPMVPVTYVVWQGDEEIAASGTILFDESIESFLPAEDIVCAASFGVYALMAAAKSGGGRNQ